MSANGIIILAVIALVVLVVLLVCASSKRGERKNGVGFDFDFDSFDSDDGGD